MKNKQPSLFLFITLSLSFWFLSCNPTEQTKKQVNKQIDSISTWIKSSRNSSYSLEKKKIFLSKAYDQIQSKSKDSLVVHNLSTVAYRFYELNDTVQFLSINKEVIELAKQLKDTFSLADAHWSYADYYFNQDIYEKSYYHFNQAYKYFHVTNKKFETARMLGQMALIRSRYSDYAGSEVLYFQTIKLFKEIKHYKFLRYTYTSLSDLQLNIKEYQRAIDYLQTGLEYSKKIKNYEKFLASTYNSLALVHLEKRDYLKAIDYYNKCLEYNNKYDYYDKTRITANIISGKAFCRLKLDDTLNVKKDLFRSLHIRDSINDKTDIVVSNIAISDYYEYIKEPLKAIKYAKEANSLSKEIKNGGHYLKSLELLAELEPKKSKEYLKEHIRYKDSLDTAERKAIDKFTRIEFETDEIIEDNKLLTQQQLWISITSVGVILILSLLYFLKVQRAKNEKLFLETEQQKANEQVYLLTLKQQSSLEEERTRERNRISQELHDGILGRLFGTRVGMGFLDLKGDEEAQKQQQAFLEELQDIEKEIREVSHKLNTNFDSSDVNFTNIINQLLESKSQVGEFQFQLNIDKNISWKTTDEIIKVNVYRIIQETLQNTIKHAKATLVTLNFSSNETHLIIDIKDNGVGFDVQKSKKGIGIKNIRSRVQKLNGTLEILSAIGKGSQLNINVPIDNKNDN